MQVGIIAVVIVLLIIVGMFVQYLSQEQSAEGKKSFFSFVGQAGKQWWEEASPKSDKRFTAEKRDLLIKEEIDQQVNIEKKLTIAQALNTCYEQICGDTDGSDIFTQGRVYLRTPVSSIKGTSQDFTGQQIGDAYYECVPYVDFCKDVSSDVKGDDAVVEFTCGEKIGKKAVEVDGEIFYKDEPYFTAIQTLNECACGCSQGKCLTCPPPPPPPPPVPVKVIDLVAKTIFLKSEQCINNFAFQLCNEGDKDVTEKFLVTVSSNGVTREYEVKENKLKELTAGKCSVISVPGLFHIGSFGLSLNQETTVEVQIDVGNQIAESKEDNNQVTGVINTGDAYYIYNQKTGKMDKCDAFCYESDLGKDYLNAGLTTYKYSGDVKIKVDYCPEWDLNGIELREQYCSLPIYQKSNGKLSNPYKQDGFNCLDVNPPRKCDGGACVPLSVTCEDAYGKEGPCLQCLDYEGFSEETLALGWASPAYWVEQDTDPFVVGEIDYTSIDNEPELVKDLCADDESLNDFFCSKHGEYPIIENQWINCYRLKNQTSENKTGHFCQEGKCVETPIDLEDCAGPKEEEIDLFKQEMVTETKLLGEKMYAEDFCLNDGDDVRKFYCEHQPENDIPANPDKNIPAKEKYYTHAKDFSCDKLLDENGMGGSCVQGKCVFFDESKKSCKEFGDIGLDPEDQGGLDVVTGYGLKAIESEYCVNDDLLVETYCSGKDPIIFDHSCKDEGKVCVNGACKTADPANQQCTDLEGEVNKNKVGLVTGTDIYGDEFWGQDSCTNKEGNQELWESGYVHELSCKGNSLKSAVLKCDAGTLCNNGECKPVDESQVSCLPDPQQVNTIITINKFGEQGKHQAGCPNGEGNSVMEVPVCDEKNPEKVSWSKLNCPDGTACNNKKGGASCDPFDPEGLKCVETEEGVTYGDGFGYEFSQNNWCAGETTVMTSSCLQEEEKECPPGEACPAPAFNPYTYKEIECPLGQQCNENSNKCEVPDPNKSSCKVLADGSVEYSDSFGNGQFYDSEECNGKEEGMGVSHYFCVDQKTLGEDFKLCAKGTECHWEKKQCLSVDYSKVSCDGPSFEEIDLSKKEKVIAYDQFGEQSFKGDEKLNEDFCLKDVESWEPDNIVIKFYCDDDDEMEVDDFACPDGTTCKDGVCG